MADGMKEEITNIRSKLTAHSPVEIVLSAEGGPHFYSSVLVDFDDDSFFILPPRRGSAEISLKEGETLRLIYPAIDALYELQTKVVGFRLDPYGEREYQCVIPRKGVRLQRREFYRLPITLEAKYRAVKFERIDDEDKLTPVGDYMTCLIDNISGGGVSVYMDTRYEIGDLYEIEFTLALETRDKKFQEIIKIARDKSPRKKPVHGAHEYCYGGYFFAIDEGSRNEIIRFILKKQIELFGRGRK
jgi:c-di-GMP-binding flagellar brake protein YcgR